MRKGLLLLTLLATLVSASISQPKAEAATFYDCSASAIMKCGATDPQNFIAKARAQKTHKDLQAIYANYAQKLPVSSYDNFAQNAIEGTIFGDGRIVVNHQVVGHSSQNLSRVRDTEFTQPVVINGVTYFANTFSKTNHADFQHIMVLFDQFGVATNAILNSTGAPQKFRAVSTNATCKLHMQQVDGKPNTYEFTTDSTADHNATIVSVEYNFGDGVLVETKSLTTPFRHRFTKDSVVKASPRVRTAATGTVWSRNHDDCTQTVNFHAVTPQPKPKPTPKPVPTPTPTPAPTTPATGTCAIVTPTIVDRSARSYLFTAQTVASNGTSLVSADANFGDGVTSTGIAPTGTNISIGHSYSKASTYTVTITAHFTNAITADCVTTLQVTDPQVAGASTTATTTPAAPSSLVNTGPGGIAIGLFGGFSVVAGFTHYYLRRRLAL